MSNTIIEFKVKGNALQFVAIEEAIRTALFVRNKCLRFWMDGKDNEDLKVTNLVKNHCLAKSINDAGWYQFRQWLEKFGQKMGKLTIAVPPHYTSQECSNCGTIVKKSLSTRTHKCSCGCELDRDFNAAINILKRGISTVGHTGTWVNDLNDWGEGTSTLVGEILSGQVRSANQESLSL